MMGGVVLWDVGEAKKGVFRRSDNYEHTHPLRGSLGRLVGASLGEDVSGKTGT